MWFRGQAWRRLRSCLCCLCSKLVLLVVHLYGIFCATLHTVHCTWCLVILILWKRFIRIAQYLIHLVVTLYIFSKSLCLHLLLSYRTTLAPMHWCLDPVSAGCCYIQPSCFATVVIGLRCNVSHLSLLELLGLSFSKAKRCAFFPPFSNFSYSL